LISFASLCAVLCVLTMPRADSAIQADIALAQTLELPDGVSLVHDRSAALGYYLRDRVTSVHQLDPNNPPFDIASWLVEYAPDYALLQTLPIDWSTAGLDALNYTPITETLWQRNSPITPLKD